MMTPMAMTGGRMSSRRTRIFQDNWRITRSAYENEWPEAAADSEIMIYAFRMVHFAEMSSKPEILYPESRLWRRSQKGRERE